MSTQKHNIPRVPLGKNGPKVSHLGFGAMGFSALYTTNNVSEEEAIKTIRHAIDSGINFIDTASFYGQGANETLLGKAIKGYPRDQLVIASKFGLFIENDQRKIDGKPETVKKSCDDSLKCLDLDYIDLYYQHRIDPNTPIEETVGALAELVKEGKIRHIGLSEASAETIRRAHKVHPITAVQVEYSLWTQDIEHNGILSTCRELGIPIVAYAPLGRGFLTGQIKDIKELKEDDIRKKHPRFQGENFEKNLELFKAVEDLAHKKGVKPAQIALAWVLAKGEDIIPIPGTRHIPYLDENIASISVKLSKEEVKQLGSILKSVSGTRYDEPGMKQVNI